MSTPEYLLTSLRDEARDKEHIAFRQLVRDMRAAQKAWDAGSLVAGTPEDLFKGGQHLHVILDAMGRAKELEKKVDAELKGEQ